MCPFPEPFVFKTASEYKYEDLEGDLKLLKKDFADFLRKMQEVISTASRATDETAAGVDDNDSDASLLQPFKDIMEEFAEDTQGIIDDQQLILEVLSRTDSCRNVLCKHWGRRIKIRLMSLHSVCASVRSRAVVTTPILFGFPMWVFTISKPRA